MLVTTEKDFGAASPTRTARRSASSRFRSRPFAIAIEFEDEDAVKALLAKVLATA